LEFLRLSCDLSLFVCVIVSSSWELGFLFFKVLETEEEEEEERTSGVGFKHQWFLLLFLGKPKRRTAMFFITPDEMFVFPLIKSFNFFILN